MRVEAAERDIEDPRRDVRHDHLCDETHRLAQRVRRIRDGRFHVPHHGFHPAGKACVSLPVR